MTSPAAGAPAQGALGVWLQAARPATLPAAAAPVAVGTACAYQVGDLAVGPAFGALLGALLIQVGTNFANDVFDHEKGADGEGRIGPTRAVAAGLVSPERMKRAMILAFGLAGVVGLYLTFAAGWQVVAIGVASVLAGIAYTGGPWPLAYHGLGDLFVLLFFGFVAVGGTAFVQVGSVPPIAWMAGAGVGAVATALLVVNNLRDRETDAPVGKRTLAVRLGRRGTLVEYAVLLAVAFAVPVALFAWLGSAWALLPLAVLPLGLLQVRALTRARTGAEFNACLEATGKLLLAYGALLAVGIAGCAP